MLLGYERSITFPSNWKKFCLLTWKNWKILLYHKRQFFIEILTPLLFLSLLMVIRKASDVTLIENPTKFKEFAVQFYLSKHIRTERKIKDYTFGYYPNSPCLQEVAEYAEKWLTDNNHLPSNPKIKVIPFSSFEKIEELVNKDELIAGIQFDDSFIIPQGCPKKLIYKIRFPGDLRKSRKYLSLDHWQTNSLMPAEQSGMRGYDTDIDPNPSYYEEGFIGIQHAIAFGFIQKLMKHGGLPYYTFMQRFPYPPHVKDPIAAHLELFMPIIIVLSFIFIVGQIVKQITTEKEQQLKEFIKIFGMANWVHWTAWFVRYFPQTMIICCFMVCMLKIPVMQGLSLLTHSDWSILLFFFTIYMLSLITFCFMITTFFEKASTASAIAGLLWFIFYVPFWISIQSYLSMPLILKLFYCIFLNTAFAFGIRLTLILETNEKGLQWSNFNKKVTVDDDLTVHYVMLMLIFDTILHLLICLYVEQIYPGRYGIPQKWYFLFTKDFWTPPKGTEYSTHPSSSRPVARYKPEAFEIEPKTKKIGIAIKSLTKQYKGLNAVNDLTVNMYEGEITILLGHNGAGKTTTISMLTGMIKPTKGTAYLNGYDVQLNLKNARKSLGLCPQHNILFDELTVKDHIIFYCKLKGIKTDDIDEEVQKYIVLLELQPKINTQSQNLSGGMKRKLSVAAALCGGSKVVLLDEPTAGMDPSARRALWNLIQAERSERTILLSTHFMDEADVLGDRVAIMSAGELKAYGSPFFLKSKFGSGYHLICVKKENCDKFAVLKLLQSFIPLVRIENEVGDELSFSLPQSSLFKFNEMLQKLEEKTEELNLEGFGISNTTLDEVFMLIGAEKNETFLSKNNESTTDLSKNFRILTGFGLCLSQWKAMFLKKFISTKRNFGLFLTRSLLPILFVLLTILMYIDFYPVLKPLPLDLSKYGATVIVVEGEKSDPDVQHYVNAIESSGGHAIVDTIESDFEDYILKLQSQNLYDVNNKYPIGYTVKKDNLKAWFNVQFLHTMPLALNIFHTAILRDYAQDPSYQFHVSNHPLEYNEFAKIKQSNSHLFGTQLAIFLGFCYAFIMAFFIIFIIQERICRAKLLQFVTGVETCTFWFSQFFFDYLTFLLSAIFALITLYNFNKPGLNTFNDMGRCFLVFIFFGFSSLPLTYLMAYIYTEGATGFSRMTSFYTLVGIGFYIAQVLIGTSNKSLADTINFIFLIFPHYFFCQSISNVHDISFRNKNCLDLCKFSDQTDCDINFLCTKYPDFCCISKFFDMDGDGIGLNLIVNFFAGVMLFAILLLWEYKIFSRIYDAILLSFFEKFYKSKTAVVPISNLDDDVLREKNAILKMSQSEIKNINLVLDRLTKYYFKFLAVKQISVAIPHSECFGLLGINGAGKTTTFKMLTGDHKVTYGDAYVKGMSITKNMTQVYHHIGYVPQFDALFDEFTGRELLRIFGLIHGIPENQISTVTKHLARNFGFQKHLDKMSKKYSGGNKRKLSVAISLIGNPSVVYMDEPTAGMDPGSKRQLWTQIINIRNEGKTIVMTSHSMEECEALCTRLAIMVNGEFVCLGSIQHLKNKFAKGLILKIKTARKKDLNVRSVHSMLRRLSQYHNSQVSDLFVDPVTEAVIDFVYANFKNAELKEQYRGLLTFYIPRGNISWSYIFGVMEANKDKFQIEDYSISQTTLEEIFLDFATSQKEENKPQ